jgi:hypothetical protein
MGGCVTTHDGRDDEGIPFTVWPKTGATVDGHVFRALSAKQAAERKARADWVDNKGSWPITYRVRDGMNGNVWEVDVAIAPSPSFIAYSARVVDLPAATHVLWHGVTLCGDLRLRGVPGNWPAGHRWISLKEVAEGTTAPPDRCEACWTRTWTPGFIEELKQLGGWR